MIGQNDDVDVFAFTVSADARIKFDVNVAEFGPNLDAVVELRDSNFGLIATANDPDSLGNQILEHLAAGDYYLTVASVGTYGWIGQYTISGNIVPGPVVNGTGPTNFIQSSLDHFRVIFDAPIDASTFTATDVTVAGPTGPVAVLSVVADPASGNTEFDIQFQPQTTSGSYQVNIGVDPGDPIRDGSGDPLNQDLDSTPGEPVEDVFTTTFQLSAPEPGWSMEFGGTGNQAIQDVIVADDGSIYVIGNFLSTASSIAKYTSNRELVWEVGFPGTVQNLDLDSSADIYITGWFSGVNKDFGGITLSTNGGQDIVVAKLSRQDGSFIWRTTSVQPPRTAAMTLR